jgi:hypothetical protein
MFHYISNRVIGFVFLTFLLAGTCFAQAETDTPTETPTDTPTFTATPTDTPTPTNTPTATPTTRATWGRLVSAATGNFTSAATWRLVDTTSHADTEANNDMVRTSYDYTQTFTPGAITIDAILIRPYGRSASVGNDLLYVQLYNNTDATEVTNVTVRLDQVPQRALTTSMGLMQFKFGSPITLTAGKAYKIGLKTTSSNTMRAFRTATASYDWCRMLRTTTQAIPGEGDNLYIYGEHTGQATGNDITVTMDNVNSSVTFGQTAASAVNPHSISLGGGRGTGRGTLAWGTAASTNYILKHRGHFAVFDGGTVTMGTATTPVPDTSTAIHEIVPGTTGDSLYYIWYAGGTGQGGVTTYGAAKTSWTKLTADKGGYCSTVGTAVTLLGGQSFTGLTGTIKINGVNYSISYVIDSTHLVLNGSAGTQNRVDCIPATNGNVFTVASTTGWKVGDTVVVTGTNPASYSERETLVIASVDSATQITTTTFPLYSHLGTSPFQAAMGNLTRNIKIRGTSSAPLFSAVFVQDDSTFSATNTEFYWLGKAASYSYGINSASSTGSSLTNLQNCSIHDFTVSNTYPFYHAQSTCTNAMVNFDNNVIDNSNYGIYESGYCGVFTNNLSVGCRVNGCAGMNLNRFPIVATGNYVANNYGVGIYISDSTGGLYSDGAIVPSGNYNNNTSVSNATYGFDLNYFHHGSRSTIDGLVSLLNGQAGITTGNTRDLTLSNLIAIGNGASNNYAQLISLGNGIALVDSTLASTPLHQYGYYGIHFNGDGYRDVRIINTKIGSCGNLHPLCSGSNGMHTYGDLYIPKGYLFQGDMWNTLLASPVEIYPGTTGNWPNTDWRSNNWLHSTDHDQVVGAFKSWVTLGTIERDTVTFNGASPSEKLTPKDATYRMESSQHCTTVRSGHSITAWSTVYESASWNGGSAPRLILKANPAIGISSDAVIASSCTNTPCSVSKWLQYTGSTAVASSDGVMCFVIDTLGTVGTVNVDDWLFSE